MKPRATPRFQADFSELPPANVEPFIDDQFEKLEVSYSLALHTR